jgi:hypothetical protein
MSSVDLESIPPRMEPVQEDPSRAVVGLYRARTRGETTLRASDHEILDAIERVHPSFAEDFRCFFVLAQTSEYTALTCVRMRDAGRWEGMQLFALRSSPFSMVALPPSTALQQLSHNLPVEQPAMKLPVPISAAQPPAEYGVSNSALEHPAPPASELPDRRRRIGWYAGAFLVTVALAADGGYRWARARQPQFAPGVNAETTVARAHLGFSATREGPVWKLSWDRAAMDALNPIGAVLIIDDGGSQQQLPLEPADLASGSLFYTPQSNELTFGLRIDRGGSHVEEHVRVMAASRTSQKPADRATESVLSNKPVQSRAAAQGVTVPGGQLHSAVASTSVPNPPVAPRKFIPPNSGEDAVMPEISVPAPPAVVLAVPVAPNLPRANPDFGPSPAAISQPPATAPAAPAPPNSGPAPAAAALVAAASPAPSVTPAPPPPTVSYVGPTPIKQVRPSVPANIPPGVSQVEVVVEIDASGKVTKVNPVGWNSTNAPLMVSAVRAAWGWVFAPAHLNGRAVPSKMNLIFKY